MLLTKGHFFYKIFPTSKSPSPTALSTPSPFASNLMRLDQHQLLLGCMIFLQVLLIHLYQPFDLAEL